MNENKLCKTCGKPMRVVRQFGTSVPAWVCTNELCGVPNKVCEQCGKTVPPTSMGLNPPKYQCDCGNAFL